MRHITRVLPLFCTVVLAAVACVQVPVGGEPAEVQPGEVAFELAGAGGAAIVVPLQINGTGPYDFVLDTGATFTCVDQALVKKLDLPPQRGVSGVGATVAGSGSVSVVRLESVALGSASASDLMACAIDLQNMRTVGLDVHGLVGLNFLKQFTVTIDFTRNVLTLVTPAAS